MSAALHVSDPKNPINFSSGHRWREQETDDGRFVAQEQQLSAGVRTMLNFGGITTPGPLMIVNTSTNSQATIHVAYSETGDFVGDISRQMPRLEEFNPNQTELWVECGVDATVTYVVGDK